MEITYMRVVYSSYDDYHKHKNDEFLQNFEERSTAGIEGYGLTVTYSRKIDTAKLRAEMSREEKKQIQGQGEEKMSCCGKCEHFEFCDSDEEDPMNRYELHKALCDGLNELYVKKNTDYGNSFAQSFDEYGMIMPVIWLGDKFNRFKKLALSGEQNVADESIVDTLRDLANYALMTIVEMKLREAEK